LTCDQQPLRFLALDEVIASGAGVLPAARPGQTPRDLELEVLRRQVSGARRSAQLRDERDGLRHAQLLDELASLKASRSWRLTAPVRAFNHWRESRRRA
jgi:hypothetical protein